MFVLSKRGGNVTALYGLAVRGRYGTASVRGQGRWQMPIPGCYVSGLAAEGCAGRHEVSRA